MEDAGKPLRNSRHSNYYSFPFSLVLQKKTAKYKVHRL